MPHTLTYYGHSCFGLHTGSHHLLIDPFISPNELAQGRVDAATVPADFILVTHGHSDHTADLIPIARRTGATVVAAFEITEWVQRQGHDKVHPMNTGGSWRFPFGTLTCTVAQHSSSLPDGTYAGNPMGFVLQLDGLTLYVAGDTALTLDMQLVGRRYRPDLALLPIGSNFTMDYVDAATAAEFVGCKRVVGMHYDTFGYIQLDHQAAQQHFANHGRELLLLGIGEALQLA